MNWVDLLLLAFLILFAVDAYGRSLLLETLDLISFLFALIISFRFYNYPADLFVRFFDLPHGLSLVIGFMIAWFLTETVFFILVRFLMPKIPKIEFPIEKYLSIIPAILRYIVFVALILVLIATFPVQPFIKKGVQESFFGSAILNNAYALEQPVKNVFGGVSDETLSFLTIKPKTDERINLGFQTSAITIDESSEQMMINLVNNERTSRGLNALKFDSNLQQLARGHSQDMFERGYFSHISPEGEDVAGRAEKMGINYMVIGENLAYAPSLTLAHQGLMNSPGHRANILAPDFNKIGIGVYDGGIYGKMFTQVFSN